MLTDVENPRRYWSDLKRKLLKEGFSQLYDKIVQLKLLAADGKRYATDCANTRNLLRIIQTIKTRRPLFFFAHARFPRGFIQDR